MMIIEEVVLNHLSDKLSVPVRMEEEPALTGAYVLIEKTGGSCSDHVKRATVAIQSYADRMIEAARLNEQVKDAMDALIVSDQVCRCSLNSDYNFTDTSRKKYRYQAVFDIVHY